MKCVQQTQVQMLGMLACMAYIFVSALLKVASMIPAESWLQP